MKRSKAEYSKIKGGMPVLGLHIQVFTYMLVVAIYGGQVIVVELQVIFIHTLFPNFLQ